MNALIRIRIQEALSRFGVLWNEYRYTRSENRSDLFTKTYEILKEYEILAGHLYRVRSELSPNDPFRQRVEDSLASISQDVAILQKDRRRSNTYRAWIHQYRTLWRENMGLFILSSLLFLASIIIGWSAVVENPKYISAIFQGTQGQSTIEAVLDKNRWFDRIQLSPLLIGVEIAVNNIKVSLLAFLLGSILGIGGLFVLAYNGLFFGSLMGFCFVNGFDKELGRFVIGHGPLELTIIVAAAFCGFMYGRVFWMRPYRHFRARMAKASSQAMTLLLGVLPWLVLAAAIEVGISPWPIFPFHVRLAIGCMAAACFWAWTLWPVGAASQRDPEFHE